MAAAGKLNLAVLISGRGSNLQSLIDACRDPDFPARIVLVISNVPDAGGLARAAAAGIETRTIDHRQFGRDRAAFESALLETLAAYPVDLICLAGFMRILTDRMVEPWLGRMVNIHPSLLPLYKGLDTHARALADGVPEAGCTVHFVTLGMDEGPVIVQRKVPILPGDTPETLGARVLEQEHQAYPDAIRRIASGKARFQA